MRVVWLSLVILCLRLGAVCPDPPVAPLDKWLVDLPDDDKAVLLLLEETGNEEAHASRSQPRVIVGNRDLTRLYAFTPEDGGVGEVDILELSEGEREWKFRKIVFAAEGKPKVTEEANAQGACTACHRESFRPIQAAPSGPAARSRLFSLSGERVANRPGYQCLPGIEKWARDEAKKFREAFAAARSKRDTEARPRLGGRGVKRRAH